MSKEKFLIWGRAFELNVQYDCYEDEDILPAQKVAFAFFKGEADHILNSDQEIKKYCFENNGAEIGEVIDNIFKYVIPVSIFVKRDEKKHVVAVMCNYKFDIEHGIALLFVNEKLVQIGSQDIVS